MIVINKDMPKSWDDCEFNSNWECAIERLSGDNADKMLAIAQDIYNTAFVRGKNYMSLEQKPVFDKIRAEITDWQNDIHDNENDAEIHDFVFERIYEILDEYKAESEVEK